MAVSKKKSKKTTTTNSSPSSGEGKRKPRSFSPSSPPYKAKGGRGGKGKVQYGFAFSPTHDTIQNMQKDSNSPAYAFLENNGMRGVVGGSANGDGGDDDAPKVPSYMASIGQTKANRRRSVNMKNAVALVGGVAGTATAAGMYAYI